MPPVYGGLGEAGVRPNTLLIPLFGVEGGIPVVKGAAVANPLPTFKPIPRDFMFAPYAARDFSQMGPRPTTIVSIGKQGSNWRLVLRNRWDQEVILDQSFNPVSTQQLTPAPNP